MPAPRVENSLTKLLGSTSSDSSSDFNSGILSHSLGEETLKEETIVRTGQEN